MKILSKLLPAVKVEILGATIEVPYSTIVNNDPKGEHARQWLAIDQCGDVYIYTCEPTPRGGVSDHSTDGTWYLPDDALIDGSYETIHAELDIRWDDQHEWRQACVSFYAPTER